MGDSEAHQIYGAAAGFFEQGGQWGQGPEDGRDRDVFTLDEVLGQLVEGIPERELAIIDDLVRLMHRRTGLGITEVNDLTTMTKQRLISLCRSIEGSSELR